MEEKMHNLSRTDIVVCKYFQFGQGKFCHLPDLQDYECDTQNFLLNSVVQGLYSPTILKNILSHVLQIFYIKPIRGCVTFKFIKSGRQRMVGPILEFSEKYFAYYFNKKEKNKSTSDFMKSGSVFTYHSQEYSFFFPQDLQN